jgi:anti-repressor protein
VGQEVIQTVNARELHGFLQVGKKFPDWMRERIAKYGFQDGLDYTTTLIPVPGKMAGRPSTEYHVSIGMAKELAMVERNDQGKQGCMYLRTTAFQPIDLVTIC